MKHKAKEDYLRIIYENEGKDGARSVDLANELKISKPSVSEMLRKLAKENLIKISPYSRVFLTAKGKKISENIYYKHRTLKKFIQKLLEYEDTKAIEEAHKLEHAFSDESILLLRKLMDEKITDKLRTLPSYVT